MKTQNHEVIALEMAINQAIDRQMDAIVQTAVALAAKLERSGMRENQLRNVLDTALHTESIELVANFIRYQIGRGRDWQHNDFGESVVATLGECGVIEKTTQCVESTVRGYMKQSNIGIPESAFDEAAKNLIRIKLTRGLLAEMNRAFLYADRAHGWGNLKPILPPIDLSKICESEGE